MFSFWARTLNVSIPLKAQFEAFFSPGTISLWSCLYQGFKLPSISQWFPNCYLLSRPFPPGLCVSAYFGISVWISQMYLELNIPWTELMDFYHCQLICSSRDLHPSGWQRHPSSCRRRKRLESHLWPLHPTPPIRSFQSCWLGLLSVLHISPLLSFLIITLVQASIISCPDWVSKERLGNLALSGPFPSHKTCSKALLLFSLHPTHSAFSQQFKMAILPPIATLSHKLSSFLGKLSPIFASISFIRSQLKYYFFKKASPNPHCRRGPWVINSYISYTCCLKALSTTEFTYLFVCIRLTSSFYYLVSSTGGGASPVWASI